MWRRLEYVCIISPKTHPFSCTSFPPTPPPHFTGGLDAPYIVSIQSTRKIHAPFLGRTDQRRLPLDRSETPRTRGLPGLFVRVWKRKGLSCSGNMDEHASGSGGSSDTGVVDCISSNLPLPLLFGSFRLNQGQRGCQVYRTRCLTYRGLAKRIQSCHPACIDCPCLPLPLETPRQGASPKLLPRRERLWDDAAGAYSSVSVSIHALER